MKKLIFPIFILVALVQWLVPGKIIFDRETILKKGTAYRFLTEPIDPSDPFIGRYVALNFKESIYHATKLSSLKTGETVFVLLKTDNAGHAKIAGISRKEPTATNAYVKARVSYDTPSGDETIIDIDFPFDKYYMEEYKAPKAEDLYRKANIDSTKKTYAVVKIWKGRAVTENVFVDNKPILELIH